MTEKIVLQNAKYFFALLDNINQPRDIYGGTDHMFVSAYAIKKYVVINKNTIVLFQIDCQSRSRLWSGSAKLICAPTTKLFL